MVRLRNSPSVPIASRNKIQKCSGRYSLHAATSPSVPYIADGGGSRWTSADSRSSNDFASWDEERPAKEGNGGSRGGSFYELR